MRYCRRDTVYESRRPLGAHDAAGPPIRHARTNAGRRPITPARGTTERVVSSSVGFWILVAAVARQRGASNQGRAGYYSQKHEGETDVLAHGSFSEKRSNRVARPTRGTWHTRQRLKIWMTSCLFGGVPQNWKQRSAVTHLQNSAMTSTSGPALDRGARTISSLQQPARFAAPAPQLSRRRRPASVELFLRAAEAVHPHRPLIADQRALDSRQQP